jgi:actin-related protein
MPGYKVELVSEEIRDKYDEFDAKMKALGAVKEQEELRKIAEERASLTAQIEADLKVKLEADIRRQVEEELSKAESSIDSDVHDKPGEKVEVPSTEPEIVVSAAKLTDEERAAIAQKAFEESEKKAKAKAKGKKPKAITMMSGEVVSPTTVVEVASEEEKLAAIAAARALLGTPASGTPTTA